MNKASTHSRNMQIRIANYYIENKKINKQTSYRAVAVHFTNKNRIVTVNQVQSYVKKMKEGKYEFSGGRRTNRKVAKKAREIIKSEVDPIELAEKQVNYILAKIEADQDAEANVSSHLLKEAISILRTIRDLKLESITKTADSKFLKELIWALVPEERGNEAYAIEMVKRTWATL